MFSRAIFGTLRHLSKPTAIRNFSIVSYMNYIFAQLNCVFITYLFAALDPTFHTLNSPIGTERVNIKIVKYNKSSFCVNAKLHFLLTLNYM